MANEDRLFGMMVATLTTVVAKYDSVPIPLPSRRYVSDGTVVHDCELVAVEPLRSFAGLPGAELEFPEHVGGPRSVEFAVHVVRCGSVPMQNGDLPGVSAVEVFAAVFATDLFFLPALLKTAYQSGEWLAGCLNVGIGDATRGGVAGGLGWTVLTIQVQVP